MSYNKRKTKMAEIEKVNITIREKTPQVEDQGEEISCFPLIVADAIGTCHRIEYGSNLVCSPGALVTLKCNNFRDKKTRDILTNPSKGLQCKEDDAFTRISEHMSKPRFAEDPTKRINLLHYEVYDELEKFEGELVKVFGEKGPKFPVVASLLMGDLRSAKTARDAYTGDVPFHHPTDKEYQEKLHKEMMHCVLIVGMDNTNDDKSLNYVEIKNSWGTKWGLDGFSKIGLDVLEDICVMEI